MKEIQHIFVRDFNQWSNQLIKEAYAKEIVALWGEGLSDQMAYFDGKSYTWYRYKEENLCLKEYMIHKDLNSEIFSEKKQQEFRKNVDEFREAFNIKPEKVIDIHLKIQELKQLFRKMYLLYPLSIAIAGLWREDFIRVHQKDAEPIIDRLMKSRIHSEGCIKENDNFMRALLGPILEKNKIPNEYVKILTVEEIDALAKGNLLDKKELDKRFKGFFYMNGKIYPTENIKQFLKEHELFLNEEKEEEIIKGMPACHGIARGKVGIIFNSEQIKNFNADILITPMTAPDFLPAIEKAKAIVTDEGGLTSHIAIVARELNKPCIMSTKKATTVLKDGDIVEVDADNGTVKKL